MTEFRSLMLFVANTLKKEALGGLLVVRPLVGSQTLKTSEYRDLIIQTLRRCEAVAQRERERQSQECHAEHQDGRLRSQHGPECIRLLAGELRDEESVASYADQRQPRKFG